MPIVVIVVIQQRKEKEGNADTLVLSLLTLENNTLVGITTITLYLKHISLCLASQQVRPLTINMVAESL